MENKDLVFREIPSINSRIRNVIDMYYKGNIHAFCGQIGVSYPRIFRLFKLDNRNSKFPEPSYNIITSIINKFTDINPEWLLTGKGSMLREVKVVEQEGGQVLEGIQPNQPTGMSVQSKEAIAYSSDSKEKDLIIEWLRNQVQGFEDRLAEKDKQIESLERQIEDLKINMERVISEKSEVIKMKDQMLKMQAEKIAELEDFKKMQEEQMRKQRSA